LERTPVKAIIHMIFIFGEVWKPNDSYSYSHLLDFGGWILIYII